MSYKKNISFEFIVKIVNIPLALITSIIIAKSLGPKDLGYAKFLILTLSTFAQFGHVGIIDATSYFQRKSKYTLEQIFKVNFTFLCIIAVLISGTLILLKYFGVIFEGYSFTIITLASIAIVFFTFLNNLLFATFVSKEKIIQVNKISLYTSFITIALYLILWSTNSLNVTSYLIVFSLKSVIGSIMMIRKIDIQFKFLFDFRIIFEEISYGIIVYFGALFIYLNYRMDQWLIKFYLGDTDLGLYAVGVALAEMILLVPMSVINPLRARLYNLDINGSEYKRLTAKTIKFSLYITLIVSIPIYFGANFISSEILYGAKYQESIEVVKILLLGILFLTFGKVGSHYFVIKGKPFIHLTTAFLVLFVNIVLNIYLIPKIGINGAAWASTASYILYGLLYITIYVLKENFTLSSLFVLSRSEVAIIRNKFKSILSIFKG
ncbi:MAG: polysaccharide biosynthesis C-terminal domain-containing protein [Candidatus Delongbacteria bacterium]|jgi:O-antigen/teichoic acid export membrane protein|nr:polysaccharide biosynthesis C-terminal domain-containing protein [Candidatus Delongbacteria bacterium]